LENDVLSLLEELEEIVDRGTKIPMTGKVLVDDNVIFDLIDRMRSSLPEEIRNAKWVLTERQKIIDEAHTEAERLLERGKTYVEKMAEENEVVKQAQAYAEDIARQAQVYAKEVKFGAMQYADEMLQQVEKSVAETLQGLRGNREELRNLAKREQREKSGEKSAE
jgi:F0F1-type ATP synthase membrane subunit b/b'